VVKTPTVWWVSGLVPLRKSDIMTQQQVIGYPCNLVTVDATVHFSPEVGNMGAGTVEVTAIVPHSQAPLEKGTLAWVAAHNIIMEDFADELSDEAVDIMQERAMQQGW